MRLKPEPNNEITKTLHTDGNTVWYNEDFVDKHEVSEIVGALAHTSLHPALLHHTRMGSRDMKKWNKACDYVVNDIVSKAGFHLPNDCEFLLDPAYAGKTADEVYTLLPDTPDGAGGGGGNQSGPGSVQRPNPSGGTADDTLSSQQRTAESEGEWKQALAQAAAIAKQQGKLPAGIDRVIDDALNPEQDWKELLREFCTKKKPCPPKWNRPNRRFAHHGLYLPTRFTTPTGTFVIVIDTSGSIQEKELDEFGTEIKAIMGDLQPEQIVLIWADAAVAGVQRFGPDDDLVFNPRGGGGTDFRPAFNWVNKNSVHPDALIYMTDGYGPFPDIPPDYPVLWLVNNNQVVPPWGEHLQLKVE